MAGRGRGRGRGLSFNKGFGFTNPADSLPPTGQPPPLYPSLQFQPQPLLSGKTISYLLTLKQDIRNALKESAYFIPPVSMKKDIERYTDRYKQIQAADQIVWDKSQFPRELFQEPRKKKRKVTKKSPVKEAIVEKLKVLEAKEETEEKETEDGEEEEEEGNEEEIDDQDLEDETDYITNYFDNGENYLEEEDDNADDGFEY